MSKNKKRTIIILQHNVEYWFFNDEKYVDGICLSDNDEEHIQKMIKEGFNQGEICNTSEEITEYGWWKIV